MFSADVKLQRIMAQALGVPSRRTSTVSAGNCMARGRTQGQGAGMTAAVSCACTLAMRCSKAARRTLDDKAIVRPATVSEWVACEATRHGYGGGGWLRLACMMIRQDMGSYIHLCTIASPACNHCVCVSESDIYSQCLCTACSLSQASAFGVSWFKPHLLLIPIILTIHTATPTLSPARAPVSPSPYSLPDSTRDRACCPR
jgi:hypothetical protein